jgi:phenylalanyl-tRNA synthetase alpha chain
MTLKIVCCHLQVINAEQKLNKSYELTDEGKQVAENGSHEALIFNAIPDGGILQAELMVCL